MEVVENTIETTNINHTDNIVSEKKGGINETDGNHKETENTDDPPGRVQEESKSCPTGNSMPIHHSSNKESRRSSCSSEGVDKDTSASVDDAVLTPSDVHINDASVSKSDGEPTSAPETKIADAPKSPGTELCPTPAPESPSVAEPPNTSTTDVGQDPDTNIEKINPETQVQNAPQSTDSVEKNLDTSPPNEEADDVVKITENAAENVEEIKSNRSEPVTYVESDSDVVSVGKGEETVKTVKFSDRVEEINAEDVSSTEGNVKEVVKSVSFADDFDDLELSRESYDIQDLINNLHSYDESEYESVEHEETEDDGDKEEGDEEDEEYEDHRSESGQSSAGSHVPTEREEGDGEEEDKKDKKLDHDEDKRDPQYIPKKGNFYEHDDRTSETDEPADPRKKAPPGKLHESKGRWGHDMYNEDLQSPKSRQELIDQYGYDIRQEEGPPKARRRRRYGRGPNKYTRSWEEVDAYTKVKGIHRPRGGRHGPNASAPRNSEEEFPPLPGQRVSVKDRLGKRPDRPVEKQEESSSAEIPREEAPPKTPPPRREREEQPPQPRRKDSPKDDGRKEFPPSVSVKKTFKQVYAEEHMPISAPSRGRGRGRGRFPSGGTPPFKQSMSSHHQPLKKKNSTAEEDIAALSQHFSTAVINVDSKTILPITQQTAANTRASSLPPTASVPGNTSNQTIQKSEAPKEHARSEQRETEKSEGKSKRYSTLRQRSLPTGQQPMHQQQVPPQQGPPPPRFIPPTEQFFHQGLEGNPGVGGAVAGPPPPPAQFTQPPPPAQFTPDVPLMTFIPPGGPFPPLYVPPPPYLPPAPLPVQVSVCPQAPPPRPEVFQGAGGITYYNTQAQVNRPVSTSRRVKLAIPIVAPPEQS